jgi:small subunit ribosomal protein S17
VSEQQDVIADVDTAVDVDTAGDAPTGTSATGTSATETPATETPATETPAKKRGERKTREGMVVSDKMNKTIVVELEDRVKHPRYSKVIRRTTKVKAHDENGTAGIGDRVLLAETRPLSATKRWRLVQVLERAQ